MAKTLNQIKSRSCWGEKSSQPGALVIREVQLDAVTLALGRQR